MRPPSRGPDFFLVGAPKSGTTALTQYLSEHPEISMCSRKEVHYFARDLFPDKELTESEYLQLFPIAPGAKRIGEASVWYLYSERAASQIKAFAPHADIIIMLRNPPEMLHSLYSQFVYGGKEPAESFEAALALDAEREAGRVERRFIPLSYRHAAMYAHQVERYLRTFGQDHVHIIIFDDFVGDVGAEYRRVCEFLRVDDAFFPKLPVVNSNLTVRNRAMMDFLRRPPDGLKRVVRAVMPHRLRVGVWRTILRANQRSEPRTPMPYPLRRRLEVEFEGEVERLGELLHRDLSMWRSAGSARTCAQARMSSGPVADRRSGS
jgi:hypothetical protein